MFCKEKAFSTTHTFLRAPVSLQDFLATPVAGGPALAS
jgi:hypothetical protein